MLKPSNLSLPLMSCDYRSLVLITVLLATALAGCIGTDGDTVDAGDDEQKAVASETTGSIDGHIVTKDLDNVEGAAVAALDDKRNMVQSVQTDKQGRFVMNDLAPGSYRVQVSAICCRAAIVSAEVKANEVTKVNLQVDELTPADLNEPYMIPREWHGFIACGGRAGVPGTQTVGVALCSATEDPNDDFIHFFNMTEGVTSVIIGMDWTPVGGVSGQKLSLSFEEGICEEVACTDAYYYATADGDPPFSLRVDLDDITEPEARWDNIRIEEEFKFRVFAGTDYATAVYQQPFSIYWFELYNGHEVPDDFNPLPDA